MCRLSTKTWLIGLATKHVVAFFFGNPKGEKMTKQPNAKKMDNETLKVRGLLIKRLLRMELFSIG